MNKSNIILIILITALIIGIFFSIKGCNEKNKQKEDFSKILTAYTDTVHFYKNKAGEEIAAKKVVEADLATIKQLYDVEKISKDFDVKPKNIIEYVKVYTQGETVILPSDTVIKIVDNSLPCNPVKAMEQSFNNKWYKLKVRVGDSSYAKIQAFDILQILQKKSTSGNIFNRKHFTEINVLNSNPNIKTTGIESFKIETASNKSKFGISIFGGYGTQDLKTFKPTIGIGATYSILNF